MSTIAVIPQLGFTPVVIPSSAINNTSILKRNECGAMKEVASIVPICTQSQAAQSGRSRCASPCATPPTSPRVVAVTTTTTSNAIPRPMSPRYSYDAVQVPVVSSILPILTSIATPVIPLSPRVASPNTAVLVSPVASPTKTVKILGPCPTSGIKTVTVASPVTSPKPCPCNLVASNGIPKPSSVIVASPVAPVVPVTTTRTFQATSIPSSNGAGRTIVLTPVASPVVSNAIPRPMSPRYN